MGSRVKWVAMESLRAVTCLCSLLVLNGLIQQFAAVAAELCGSGVQVVNLTCEAIRTDGGYVYTVPDCVPRHFLRNHDCEQGWHLPGLGLVANGNPAQLKDVIWPVVRVTPENLTTSYCVDGLHLIIEHTAPGYRQDVYYSAFNTTALEEENFFPDTNGFDWTSLLWIIIPAVIIAAFLILCILNAKRIQIRCQRPLSFCRRNNSLTSAAEEQKGSTVPTTENRAPENGANRSAPAESSPLVSDPDPPTSSTGSTSSPPV